jgi:hypothetical protein
VQLATGTEVVQIDRRDLAVATDGLTVAYQAALSLAALLIRTRR